MSKTCLNAIGKLAFLLVLFGISYAFSGCYNKGYGCKGRAKTITGEDVKKRDPRYE